MRVTASQVIEAVLQQPFGFLFDFRSIAANNAGQIELEHHVHLLQSLYLQPIITQYFTDNKSEIWSLSLIAHSKR